MTRIEIEGSSNIKALEYEEDTQSLAVTFGNETIYDYAGVDPALFDMLVNAYSEGESVGKAFNGIIRGSFDGVKRAPEEESDN